MKIKSMVLLLALLIMGPAVQADPLGFYPVQPFRWFDTRNGACEIGSWVYPTSPCPVGALHNDETRFYNAQASASTPEGERVIPLGAKVLVLTVTTVDATGDGYLVLYGGGEYGTSPRPHVSSLNFDVGRARSNLVFVPLGQEQLQDPFTPFWPDTAVFARVAGGGTVHVVFDIVGYFE